MKNETLLPLVREESNLVLIEDDKVEYRIHPETGMAWARMKRAARRDGVHLSIVSAFRSVARQAEIVEKKRREGIPDSIIYQFSALPGHSEHHSGRAVDIGTEGCEQLTEEFEYMRAFDWLFSRSQEFGFSMSYPRGNRFGIGYEPWHWFHTGSTTIRLREQSQAGA